MSSWLHRALLRSEYSDEVLFARPDIDADEKCWKAILATGFLAAGAFLAAGLAAFFAGFFTATNSTSFSSPGARESATL